MAGGKGRLAAQGSAPAAYKPSTKALEGLPTPVNIPGVGPIEVGPYQPARQAAADYMRSTGRKYDPPTTYAKVDPERAKRVADAYESMVHDPQNPEVKAAYRAMIEETLAQFEFIQKTGLKISFIDYAKDGDPYAASPRLATEDVKKNNHLWVFPTSAGFGSNETFDAQHNPLLAETKYVINGHKLLANDVFRIVHDYFGHIKEGNGFRADGEENAWRSHAAMYSPLARRAMTSETRGQNSWVNYGPHGEKNRKASAADTVFADQKTGIMPVWVSREGASDRKRHKRKAELQLSAILKFNRNHEPAGSSVGGQFAGAMGGGERVHEGDIITTSDIDVAVRELHAGRKVILNQRREVSTLIEELGRVAREMVDKGEKAPDFDLCNVSVKGTNLFCHDSKGIPRMHMPQLSGIPLPGSKADKLPKDKHGGVNIAGEFQKHLDALGYKTEDVDERADYLRATQNQLNGVKVAGIANAMRAGKLKDRRLYVSKENYIVDGHHNWAAKIAVDFDDNKTGDLKMPVARVNVDILTLLEVSKKFAKEWGIPQASVSNMGAFSVKPKRKKKTEFLSILKFNKYHEPAGSGSGGRFASASGGVPQGLVDLTEHASKEERKAAERAFRATNPNTVDGLYEHATQNNDHLTDLMEYMNDTRSGVHAFMGPMKARKRVEQKITEKGYDGANHVTDVVRATIVVKDVEQVRQVMEKLAKKIPTMYEGIATTDLGYADAKSLIRFPNGQIGEVQIIEPNMLEAKFKGYPDLDLRPGHDLYYDSRELSKEDKKGRKGFDLHMESKEVYGVALKKANKGWRNFIKRGNQHLHKEDHGKGKRSSVSQIGWRGVRQGGGPRRGYAEMLATGG